MAKLPVLISKLAPFDGRSPDALAHVGRLIRERGLIATTKRGSGAAEMTTRDAANLLIALHGAEFPKDAPKAVDRFRALPLSVSTPQPPFPECITAAFSASTFGEALERLIDVVPDLVHALKTRIADEFAKYAEEPYTDEEIDRDLLIYLRKRELGLEVRFSGELVVSELYTTDDEFEERRTELAAIFSAEISQSKAAILSGDLSRLKGRFKHTWIDRETVSSFGLPTLIAVWLALHPAEQIGSITESSLQWMRNLPGFAKPLVFARR